MKIYMVVMSIVCFGLSAFHLGKAVQFNNRSDWSTAVFMFGLGILNSQIMLLD